MVGEGYTSILLEEGEYTIKVQKNSSDGKWIYKASKKVFVGGDTSTKINFELIKNLKDDGSKKTFRGHTGNVYSVAISPNGKYIVSGSFDDTVKLWELDRGEF
jgi:WD40 repeat protein